MEEEGIVVLSLFDGMSCGQLALQRLGVKVKAYYACEIDRYAMKVTQYNFPNTIQLGDVTKVKGSDLPEIDLLIGGSPCQGFSFAGKQLAFDDPRSKLFFEFVRLKNECQPAYFLLENVKMKKEFEIIISKYMGVAPIEINSALVSAQNRVRLYWTNIANEPYGLFGDVKCMIPQPKDKGILLRDILESDVPDKYYLSEKMLKYVFDKNEANIGKSGFNYNFGNPNKKSNTILTRYGKDGKECLVVASRGRDCALTHKRTDYGKAIRKIYEDGKFKVARKLIQHLEPRTDGKTNCLTSVQKDNLVLHQRGRGYNKGGKYIEKTPPLTSSSWEWNNTLAIRRLTPTECERLQTVPDGYTSIVSDTQRYKMLGNGWTVDVITHILFYLLKNDGTRADY